MDTASNFFSHSECGRFGIVYYALSWKVEIVQLMRKGYLVEWLSQVAAQ